MKKFLALSIFLFLLSTIVPPKAGAVCRIASSGTSDDNCISYTLTEEMVDGPNGIGRPSCTSPTFGTSTVCCDSADDLSNTYAVRSPLCGGSSPEITPACNVCGGTLFCYGNNYRRSPSDPVFPPPAEFMANRAGPVAPKGPQVVYNGVSYNIPLFGVYFCDSNVFGCGNTSCSNRNGGAGESRIWIPHLKNISALATLLQTLFAPGPSVFVNNALPSKTDQTAGLDNPAAVTSRINYHQGFDDPTITVGNDKNNSSLIQDREAPAPLYNFDGSGPYNQNGLCSISDAITNPGDDLLGPKITVRLMYTQKYEYPTAPKPDGCTPDNGTISDSDRKNGAKCCSEYASNDYQALKPDPISVTNKGQVQISYKCAARAGRDFPTEGRAVVYTKTPLVEYIYNTLVVGPQSVLKRIFPQGNPKEFKEIPAKAEYVADATGVNQADSKVNLKAGDGSTQPTIYFPHLGSLYEYFLVGLQKALRPLTSSGSAPSQPISSGSPQETCEYSTGQLQAAAERASTANQYRVSTPMLLAISRIEGSNKYVPGQPYACAANSSRAVGPMQITDDTYTDASNYVTQPSERLPLNTYACNQTSGKLNRCNIYDAMTMSARLLSLKMTFLNGQPGNVTSCNDIYFASNKYYGKDTPDNYTRAWNSRVANPPPWPMNYADIVFALGKQYYGLNCSYISPL